MPTPPLSSRERDILDLVAAQGFLGIDELARRFDVTPQTIRRGVNQLCDRGLLRRRHGGVGLPAATDNLPYQRRQVQQLEGKRRIAQAVAAFIPNGSTMSIGIGTTPQQVAMALRTHAHLRVVTNSLNAANVLVGCPGIEITLAGGTLRPDELDVVGLPAAQCFSSFKTDFAVFGVAGIDDDGTLLDFDADEVMARQAMLAHCRSSLLVADVTKFGRSALARGGQLGDVAHLFLDAAPPTAFAPVLAAAGNTLHVAAPTDEAALA
ncbi:MAG: DeoR/GlpR transcriptional regulator [Hydrogenophaga sp.]|uniref:DeoR/GlpR family DNA-binding transcription regulator n=1 Tax=Hydrogenophaga sp. TaxID=1904254 RepID=UPI001D2F72DF|nr:DeoR/GlpR family DNA-binding transcription regulator [Hydrogenophaga sp.]MBX3609398.1 DeoR/GlpR transcriptional regulator [Hydrogenophaga sp.]